MSCSETLSIMILIAASVHVVRLNSIRVFYVPLSDPQKRFNSGTRMIGTYTWMQVFYSFSPSFSAEKGKELKEGKKGNR